MILWCIPVGIVCLIIGAWFGTRVVVALQLHTYRNVDDLITMVEDSARITHDGRITPDVVLPSLYQWRQSIRLSDHHLRHERPQQDYT